MPASFLRSPLATLLAAPAALVIICADLAPARAAEPLAVTLVSSVTHVQPGTPFYVGLHLVHREGYHTYWKFPGIVGVPTSMDWILPEGWKAEDITWPEPEQVHMFQIRAQGYHGDLLLPIRITPPKDLNPGSKAVLKGKSAWMCCGRDCNPGFNELVLEVPVAATAPVPEKKWESRFAAALASHPKPIAGWTPTAVRTKDQITLTLTPAGPDVPKGKVKDVLFFTDDGLVNADKDQTLERREDGTLVLKLAVSQYADQPLATKLVGVLQSPQGWDAQRTRSVAIEVPITVVGG